ncbi:MAG TPA: hypothetical protein VGD84_01840 [Pseudonocardiaceae bacterium]
MTDVPANRPALSGDRVYRIHWLLGTDRLRAVCHCTAEREFEDPVEVWEWLLAHPAGHHQSAPEPAASPVRPAVPAPA